MKRCRKCDVEKKDSYFYKEKRNLDGLRSFCKECDSVYNTNRYKNDPEFRAKQKKLNLEWRLANKDKRRDAQYKRYYGISLEEYNQMLLAQSNKCAICGINQNSLKRPMAVDHNHKTGKIRGLICSPCNTALGSIKENTDTCLGMIAYIKKHLPST